MLLSDVNRMNMDSPVEWIGPGSSRPHRLASSGDRLLSPGVGGGEGGHFYIITFCFSCSILCTNFTKARSFVCKNEGNKADSEGAIATANYFPSQDQ